ncbi:hypothetical protein KM043_003424 [Ampulex compressa]|nr:hypothetical protein KM043_003424 [Ampulex compressa]
MRQRFVYKRHAPKNPRREDLSGHLSPPLHGGLMALALNSAVRAFSVVQPRRQQLCSPPPPAAPPPFHPHAPSFCAEPADGRHAHAATTFCIKSFVYGPRRFIGSALMCI